MILVPRNGRNETRPPTGGRVLFIFPIEEQGVLASAQGSPPA